MKNKNKIYKAVFIPLILVVVFLLGFFVFISKAQAGCCYCGDINTNPNFCIKGVIDESCPDCKEPDRSKFVKYDAQCSLCPEERCCVKTRKIDSKVDQCVVGLTKAECEEIKPLSTTTGENVPKSCYALKNDQCKDVQIVVAGKTEKEPPKAIFFKPNITIPGSKFIAGKAVQITGASLGEWISAFYLFFCGVVGILAAVNIIYGGFKWLTSFGNQTRIASAKERISSAIIGIVLTLGAYVFLLTISPRLVEFKGLSIKEIEPIEQTFEPGAELPEDYGVGQECFYTTYGKTKEEVENQLFHVVFQNHVIDVHKKAKDAFEKVNAAITNAGISYSFDSILTFDWREAVGAEGKMSLHSWGIAMDINGSRNPYCPYQWDKYPNLTAEQKEKCKNGGLVTDLPDEVIQAFKSNNFVWGGSWTTAKDAMHFEWHGNCY